MTKKNLKSKAAKGIAYGDVANTMVRNLLTLLSKKIGEITEEQIKETIEFFDKKCPYTGKNIPIKDLNNITDEEYKKLSEEFAMDHIIPQNRVDCGLNIYGNLVLVDKTANQKKRDKSVEDFIKNNNEVDELKNAPKEERENRLDKIREFQEKSGYNKYIEKTSKLSAFLEEKYAAVTEEQNAKLKEIEEILGLNVADSGKSDSAKSKTISGDKKKGKNAATAVFVDFLNEKFKSMPASTLSSLCDKKYCSENLKISFPVLVENVPGTFPADRYYKEPLFVNDGKAYRLTSQFTPRRNHKKVLEEWIEKYNEEHCS